MRSLDAVKVRIVGTPLQPLAARARRVQRWRRRRRHPELADVMAEDARIATTIRALLEPRDNGIDVGCHVGKMLALMIRCAPMGVHAAVEASPRKAALLRRRWPEVAIHAAAVSDREGSVTFYETVEHSGFSGLRPPVDEPENPASSDRVQTVEVPCTTLDALFADGPPIRLIKIDVEGAELAALAGAAALVERDHPAILFECAYDDDLVRFGYTRAELFDLVCGYGYDIWVIVDWVHGRGPLDRDAFLAEGRYPSRGFNYLAMPAGTVATPLER